VDVTKATYSGRIVLFAAPSALRCDFTAPRARTPVASLIRVGAHPLWVLDHRAKRYRALALPARDEATVEERPGPMTRFGPTISLTAGWLEIVLLQTRRLAALAPWWEALFGGLVPCSYRDRLPFAYELREDGSTRRVELRSVETVRLGASAFRPPDGYRLRQDDGETRSVPLRPPPRPQPAAGLARESAIGALLLSGAGDELAKLQLRDDLVERVRRAVNDVSQRLNTYGGEGLTLDLGPLLADLAVPPLAAPPGTAAIADRLLLRALFWHLGVRLKRIFASQPMRAALLMVIDAAKAGSPTAGTIEPDASVSGDDLELFRAIRDLVAASPGSLVPVLENIRDSDLSASDEIDLLTTAALPVGDPVELAARAWFNREFRRVSLQPKTGLTSRNGRNHGWRTNGYIAEGLGELIDIELDIERVELELAQLAVLNPTRRIDETDARFAAIDAAEGRTPGSTKRAGFATRVRVNGVRVECELTTTPTTRSLAIAALLLTQPQEILKLWNVVNLGIDLRGVEADVLVYFEQDRLSPAGPALKVWIGPLEADSHDVSGWVLSGDPFVAALGDLVVNEVLDHVTPALIDRIRLEAVAAFDKVAGAVADFFGVTRTPLPPPGDDVQQALREALVRGRTLREDIRLQGLLNLDREEEFERLTRQVDETQGAWDTAFRRLEELWREHVAAAKAADVELTSFGFNPRPLPRPILNRAGAEVPAAELDALQRTFDAWIAQRRVVDALDAEVREAREQLEELVSDWPEGQTACEAVAERRGYRVALGICRLGAGSSGRALVYPSGPRASSDGDLTLLVSARTFGEMTRGAGFAYRGDVRITDGSPAVLPELPPLDWWRDAEDPAALGERPTDLRDGPPPLPPGPSSGGVPDWRGYWSVIEVAGRTAQLIPVRDPAPTERVAEILVGVTVMVGVTTYTAVTVERCGPDLTRLAGELQQPPLVEPGDFRPPAGPTGPRPGPGRPLDVEIGFTRAPNALEPSIVTANALEATRLRVPATDGANPFGGVHLSPLRGIGTDAHCEVVSAWEVMDREVWLRARLELRLPVFVGFANSEPRPSTGLPGRHLLGTRARLPILTYRFDVEPIAPLDPAAIEAAGPLAGLAEGANRAWLADLMANHALALVRNSADRHRLRDDNRLRYAYGFNARGQSLSPEGFTPYAILAMHPTHWGGSAPPPLTDREPPHLTLETFGANPAALNLAIRLTASESLLDKLGS
jgi:hypothetical protein